MAEVTGLRNNALPYPMYGSPWGLIFPILDNTGALVSGAAGLDSKVSLNGDTFADCTNEATEIGSSGMYSLLLTDAEMAAQVVTVIVKTSTTDAKTTPMVLYPRQLVQVRTNTTNGGTSNTVVLDTLASAVDDFYTGMLASVLIDGVLEVRLINDYDGSGKTAYVTPAWVTASPDTDDPYTIFLPDGVLVQSSNLVSIDGKATNANNATLNLKQLNIVNSGGSAIIASSTGSNGHGLAASGNGSGEGISATGGATGNGLEVIGGATSGAGLVARASGDGNGVTIAGNTNGDGINASGGATSGRGMYLTGSAGGGYGLFVQGVGGTAGIGAQGGTNKPGIQATGNGSGSGIDAIAGTTGIGLHVVGGATSGDGLKAEAAGTGLDINAPNSDIGNAVIADAVWDEAVDGAVTARQSLRLANSANGAKLSGAATTTVAVRDLADTKDRVTATVDASGNRTAVTRDLT